MATSHRIVRDDIDYCNLSVYEFNGIRFVSHTENAGYLRCQPIDVDDIPPFITHIRVAITSNRVFGDWVDIYVLNKKDIRELCRMYAATIGVRCRVLGYGLILGVWLPSGELTGSFRKIQDFYPDVSQEELEKYSF